MSEHEWQSVLIPRVFWAGITIAVLLIVLAIVSAIVKRRVKAKKGTKAAVNGVLYIVRVIFGFIILITALSIFELIDDRITLTFTTVLSTAIGFSSAIAVGNMVAGIYILVSRPYKIGDYVQFGAIEGFIKQIGINYTKVRDGSRNIMYRIPNKVVMNENLVVFDHVIENEESGKKGRDDRPDKKDSREAKAKALLQQVKGRGHEITYEMPIEGPLQLEPGEVLQRVEKVFDKWEPVFGARPRLIIVNFGAVAFRGRLLVTAKKMDVVQEELDKLLDDVWFALEGVEA